MTTDNDPVDYIYISKRLTRELVQQHEAARPRRLTTASFRVPLLSAAFSTLKPDYHNRFDLTRRATEAVSDNTGSLDNPGTYVRATLPMRCCKVVFHLGFEDSGRQEVAAFFADGVTPDAGHVFVALFGSVTNLKGRRAGAKLGIDSHPSDAEGMYEILDATREPSDCRVKGEYLQRDRGNGGREGAFDSAYTVMHRDTQHIEITGIYEFLATAHEFASGIEIHRHRYDVALLGGTVWVASSRPESISH